MKIYSLLRGADLSPVFWILLVTGGAQIVGAQDVSFIKSTTMPAPPVTGGIAAGDLNGDGIPDIVLSDYPVSGRSSLLYACSIGSNVAVLLGNGDGNFQDGVPLIRDEEFGFPRSVGILKFRTGSQQPAVAFVQSFSPAVGVTRISFDPSIGFSGGGVIANLTAEQGGPPGFSVVGDFNNDGIDDIAVTQDYSGSVTVFLASEVSFPENPTQPPSPTFMTHATYAVGGLPSGITTGDFNGDGILDLAVANSPAGGLSILLGKGDGTFAKGSVIDLTKLTPAPQIRASPNSSLAVGDFNGDGRLDLVFDAGGIGSLYIVLGNGDGTFSRSILVGNTKSSAGFGAAHGGQSIAIGDFNQDGSPDIGVASTIDGVLVFMNKGDGTFAGGKTIDMTARVVSLISADFNGDGKPDLAAVSMGLASPGSVSIFINNTPSK